MIQRTRVKICGFTRSQDALIAAKLGVDAIGLVFYPPSPRYIEINIAQEIIQILPPFITVVALFYDPQADLVEKIINNVSVDSLQFHGDECESFCKGFGLPYFKTITMRPGINLTAYAETYPSAQGFLLDTYVPKQAGGTGQAFDWTSIPKDFPYPLILAGGLKPENVQEAILQVKPYAVDVSSGVEAAKGIKDAKKMELFLKNIIN